MDKSATHESRTTDLQSLSVERLEHEITSFAAHLSAAMCRWLLLVAEFDRRRAYESWECLNTAQWLNVQVGISLSTGRQHVAVANQLVRLPLVRNAFGQGEISYSRVRAVCRVATPNDEQRWLEVARNATASQLDRIVSDTIRAARAAQPEAEAVHESRRSLTWFIDDDGMYEVQGRLPPEVGALLAKLVNSRIDRESTAQYEKCRADAFGAVLADAAAHQSRDDAGGKKASVLLVVHRYENGMSRIENGPPIPEGLADRLADGADEIVAVHTLDSIRYERRRRTPTTSMRRYLHDRDGSCRFPGCGQRALLHAHHVTFFAHDGETSSRNLVMLCPRHHGAVHNRGWTVSGNADTGGLVFRDPHGRAVTSDCERSGDAEAALEANRSAGVEPVPTIKPRNGGEPYDHHLTVWALANPGLRA